MALPVAHVAVAYAICRSTDRPTLICLAFLSIVPDFDLLLVWMFDVSMSVYHRTFTHSLLFVLLVAALWLAARPKRLQTVSFGLVFLVVASHGFLDMLCTADATDHGVMLFWPLTEHRLGWPVLVPLYRLFASTPFTVRGFVLFTFLEVLLVISLWLLLRSGRSAVSGFVNRMRRRPFLPPGEE